METNTTFSGQARISPIPNGSLQNQARAVQHGQSPDEVPHSPAHMPLSRDLPLPCCGSPGSFHTRKQHLCQLWSGFTRWKCTS